MRLNYTTYDVRRDDDVIHPTSSHCNIMVLNPSCSSAEHPFWYARVLGIYHSNVIYTGTEVIDYQPQQLHFLWVRWYQIEDIPAGWDARRLDRLRFPSIHDTNSFGFLDPADVLRSCHIAPVFTLGKVHADGSGISRHAHDGKDWKSYYVLR
jgi:hypothetical protein